MYHFNPFQVLPFSKAKIPVDELIFRINISSFRQKFFFIAQTLVLSPSFRDDKARQTEQGQE